MKITTKKAYEAVIAALREYCDKKGYKITEPDENMVLNDLARENYTFLQGVITNTPNNENGYIQKVAAEALLYRGIMSTSIVGTLKNAAEFLGTFEGTIEEYFETFLTDAAHTHVSEQAADETAPEVSEETKEPEEPKEPSITIGGVTLTASKVREKLNDFKFEMSASNDELYDALMAILEPVGHIDLGVDYNTPENKFKWAYTNLLFNEVGQTSLKSLEDYEEAYKDKPVIVVPANMSLAERAILNAFLEKTLGEPTEDNKVGVLLRCLAMAYTYTDFSFNMLLYFLSVLKINTFNGFKAHIRNIAGLAYMALEEEKKRAYQNSVADDELDQIFKDPKREAELAKIQAAMGEPVAPMPVNKVVPSMSSGGGSSSGSFSDVVDVAIGAAVIGVVGYGAYKVYDHFFGSGSASDGDVELMREDLISLR